MSAVAQRYVAAAVAALGKAEAPALSRLQQQLQQFVDLYRQHPALQQVLHDPSQRGHWATVVAAVGKRLDIDGVGLRLLQVLARNHRLGLLDAVLAAVQAAVDRQAGRLRAQVRVAIAPTKVQHKALVAALVQRLGQPVEVDISLQPDLLAGLVCQVGDFTFDTSLKRQLAILAERLGTHA